MAESPILPSLIDPLMSPVPLNHRTVYPLLYRSLSQEDPRPSAIDRHLPNTPQVQWLWRRAGKAHVFNDRLSAIERTQL